MAKQAPANTIYVWGPFLRVNTETSTDFGFKLTWCTKREMQTTQTKAIKTKLF